MSNIKEDVFEQTIMSNIKRKSEFVDQVQMVDGIPLFSWIDLNPTELCNRTCEFCPRVDKDLYPNQNLNISLDLCKKINDELKSLNYKGGLVLSGYSEPMLHPELIQVVKILGDSIHLELVTNGDKLTSKIAKELFENGLDIMVVSMYDGPHQIDEFTKIFKDANITENSYILRDRWYSVDEDYGVKLTNRAGVATEGNQDIVNMSRPCYYPFYSVMLDWNGDVMLCVQDWNKKIKMGNITFSSLLDIWQSSGYKKYRNVLKKGKRVLSPCSGCNTNGTLHGKEHLACWDK
ncbi:MAG: radical SAM protein [Lentimicrobiaceae bacterium]|nr:radical SAM protein [Lentimicrobiaceae bacterium]